MRDDEARPCEGPSIVVTPVSRQSPWNSAFPRSDRRIAWGEIPAVSATREDGQRDTSLPRWRVTPADDIVCESLCPSTRPERLARRGRQIQLFIAIFSRM